MPEEAGNLYTHFRLLHLHFILANTFIYMELIGNLLDPWGRDGRGFL